MIRFTDQKVHFEDGCSESEHEGSEQKKSEAVVNTDACIAHDGKINVGTLEKSMHGPLQDGVHLIVLERELDEFGQTNSGLAIFACDQLQVVSLVFINSQANAHSAILAFKHQADAFQSMDATRRWQLSIIDNPSPQTLQ